MVKEGYFVSDIRLNVVRKMDTIAAKSSDGKNVERIYGKWAMDNSCIIKFEPGKKVWLTQEDVNLPNVRTLIETGQLKRSY